MVQSLFRRDEINLASKENNKIAAGGAATPMRAPPSDRDYRGVMMNWMKSWWAAGEFTRLHLTHPRTTARRGALNHPLLLKRPGSSGSRERKTGCISIPPHLIGDAEGEIHSDRNYFIPYSFWTTPARTRPSTCNRQDTWRDANRTFLTSIIYKKIHTAGAKFEF